MNNITAFDVAIFYQYFTSRHMASFNTKIIVNFYIKPFTVTCQKYAIPSSGFNNDTEYVERQSENRKKTGKRNVTRAKPPFNQKVRSNAISYHPLKQITLHNPIQLLGQLENTLHV